jgi:hypothetical protein
VWCGALRRADQTLKSRDNTAARRLRIVRLVVVDETDVRRSGDMPRRIKLRYVVQWLMILLAVVVVAFS